MYPPGQYVRSAYRLRRCGVLLNIGVHRTRSLPFPLCSLTELGRCTAAHPKGRSIKPRGVPSEEARNTLGVRLDHGVLQLVSLLTSYGHKVANFGSILGHFDVSLQLGFVKSSNLSTLWLFGTCTYTLMGVTS